MGAEALPRHQRVRRAPEPLPGGSGGIDALYDLIDEYDHHPDFPGSLTADLAQFYNIGLTDVWSGKVPVRRVLVLVEHLTLIPASRVRMIRFGGDLRSIGWDIAAELAADSFDQISAIVSAFGKKPLTPDQMYPRPGRANGEQDTFAPTIADFNVGKFMGEINRQQ
ncbi:hypothetical protein ACSHWG_00915 [Leucobacter sp. Z1108]|uniref:hypothetical protein n=1 Tax=Leucobacter sp. Z1108 TaxID=3439066 RepID=UPI003F29FAE8